MEDRNNLLRKLPAVEEVLQTEAVRQGLTQCPRSLLVEAVREILQEQRAAILAGGESVELSPANIGARAAAMAFCRARSSLRKVINATGVVLHTNLGRAVLGRKAQEAVSLAAGSYTNLELDLEKGQRGSRQVHVEGLWKKLSGAEAALVVNNNAAAVLLVLSTLARGREVIVSRGQLVEIGGSFRVPEIMAQSGARMVEVGTTNKTHPFDYEKAITQETAALLKVHTSNFKLVGFTREVTCKELVHVGKKYGLPVVEDLGSGLLLNLNDQSLQGEPCVVESVAAGVDVLTFSGDKLLGGPQAGIILGQVKYLEQMRQNPLARALRADKFTLAALEATLREYLDPGSALREVPTLYMLTLSQEELERRAQELCSLLRHGLGDRASVEVCKGFSTVGGGSLPGSELPTSLVRLAPARLEAGELGGLLRRGEPAVLGRVQEGCLWFDLRTVLPAELPELVRAVLACGEVL